MKANAKAIILLIIASVILAAGVTGCNMQNSPPRKPQSQQEQSSRKQVQLNPELAKAVVQVVKTIDGVEESTAVVIDREISVAAKVTGFDRLRLKSIRKEMTGKVGKIAPRYKVHVSTDKKIFAELQKVENQIKQSRGMPIAGLKNKIEKLNKDMHG